VVETTLYRASDNIAHSQTAFAENRNISGSGSIRQLQCSLDSRQTSLFPTWTRMQRDQQRPKEEPSLLHLKGSVLLRLARPTCVESVLGV
jgi:hypothetical protein